ncbi:ATP-grasp domain-containing protein [Bacteroides reticulotermitis]|uniref:ATP-grasp domain-containing protein n=1 Tax=Bacteroides reticulotermitis TaxID=1133319 RepID=UPI003A888827
MRILVTAIGSMSAQCVISTLKRNKHTIIGCDIYPAEWHYESQLCDQVYLAPKATNESEYIAFLLDISKQNNIDCLLPLTDLEIDVINTHRDAFTNNGIQLCMPAKDVLEIVRNKYRLHTQFKNDPKVPSIATYKYVNGEIPPLSPPCIAKPYNGRSSEGLLYIQTINEFNAIKSESTYILQEYKAGNIYTVDHIRCEHTGSSFSIAREELLRTKNGAGLTVKITNDPLLYQLTAYIGQVLGINGCINMEFIKNDGHYFLIDINPRFSAGIAFSQMVGYDMVTNHLNCFTEKGIDSPIEIKEHILTKRHLEETLL